MSGPSLDQPAPVVYIVKFSAFLKLLFGSERCLVTSGVTGTPSMRPLAKVASSCVLGGVSNKEDDMHEAEIGWIAAIIIGGLAGWLAEMFMKSGTGILTNIVLGIVGAALANFLLGIFGVALGGWLGYLIAGFIGACILIFAWRAIKGRT